jgi:glycine dehydrogenase subunit 1
MTYLPHTDEERRSMLRAIGLEGLEDLFAGIPERLRFPDLDLPPPLSELEVERELEALAARNSDVRARPCFLGAGAYRHYVPATVDTVLQRGEFLTAYTPYQPELSQGLLQATFEYQTMMCRLTGMEVATASHYDGASALAEAVLLSLSIHADRRRIVLSPGLHPRYREVLHTYLGGREAVPFVGGPGRDLAAAIDAETAVCVVQSPNFYGQLEPVRELARAAHDHGALLVAIPDPVALGLLRSPGEEGADLVAAEGQGLGIPLCYGGPHLGILAARQAHVRRLPGRLAGRTVDAVGERGYVLTLTTREQHVRRERATSNICTNAALMALAASVHLATLGRSGLRKVATLCYQKSHYAARRLAELPGCRVNPQAPDVAFFKEFVLELPLSAALVNEALRDSFGIVGGYDLGLVDPSLSRRMLIAVTEQNSRAEIDALVEALAGLTRKAEGGKDRGRA